MNKFEQLIEYVINDEEQKARELFHDIVVEKSRTIYESMMEEETVEEAKHDDEESMEEAKEDEDESIEEGLGGDQADDLINDVEAEEEGMMEADDEEMEMDSEEEMMGGDDMGDAQDEANIEDRVVDLEDKLDELMAEFEALMGDEGGDEEADFDMDMEVGSDGMDAEEVVDDELETEGMMENVSLKAAPKPTTSEEGGTNTKSTVAANSGAKGAMAKPVSTTGAEAKGRPAPTAKDMGSTTEPNVKPATKPTLSQAAGVNNKSVIQ
jgi:hypothetical protein